MADVDRIARKLARGTMGLARSSALASEGVAWSTISRRVERGAWERPHHGVVDVTGAAWSWERRVLAAVLACPPGTLASHRTAGALLDLPGLKRAGRPEVTTPRRHRTKDVPFTVHSSLRPDAGTSVGGVPCTMGLRTGLDLGTCLDDRAYGRAIRELLRRGDITAAVEHDRSLQHLPGYTRLLATVQREWRAALHRTESPLEDDALDWLIRQGFTGFVTQHDVQISAPARAAVAVELAAAGAAGGNGTTVPTRFRLDIAWPEAHVAVEVQGARWHADRLSVEADAMRKRLLEADGWTILYLRASDLHGGQSRALAERLRRTLSA